MTMVVVIVAGVSAVAVAAVVVVVHLLFFPYTAISSPPQPVDWGIEMPRGRMCVYARKRASEGVRV